MLVIYLKISNLQIMLKLIYIKKLNSLIWEKIKRLHKTKPDFWNKYMNQKVFYYLAFKLVDPNIKIFW